MERLRDQRSAERVAALAIELVRSRGPTEPPAGTEQRIHAALLEPRAARPRILRPAFVVLALVALVAIAAAAAVARYVARYAGRPASGSKATGIAVGKAAAPPASRLIVLPSSSDPVQASTPKPIARSIRSTAAKRKGAPGKLEAEEELVLEATRALRRDHDPARATRILDNVLRLYPSGMLIEESLALAIESRSASNDDRAAELAAQYLKRFPTGRFRQRAADALERFGD